MNIPQYEIEKRKNEAEAYLNKVVDLAVGASEDMKKTIKEYFMQMIESSFKYRQMRLSFRFSGDAALDEKINSILSGLRESIYNIIYDKSIRSSEIAEDKENGIIGKAFISSFLASKIYNKTLKERISIYVNQLKYEVEAYISAGMYKGFSKNEIWNQWIKNISNPYRSVLMVDSFNTNFETTRIQSKGIKYGKGRMIGAFGNLKRLEQNTVFQSYNTSLNHIWEKDTRIVGWFTVRGSSYPCSYCDMQAYTFHPKTESFLQWHARCVCIMIPVYKGEI